MTFRSNLGTSLSPNREPGERGVQFEQAEDPHQHVREELLVRAGFPTVREPTVLGRAGTSLASLHTPVGQGDGNAPS